MGDGGAVVARGAFRARIGIVVLFALMSFAALREFLTLTAKRRADHWVLDVFVLRGAAAAIPAGRLRAWIGLFTIFIPVYAFLFLPVLAAVRGDTRGS